MNAGNGSTIKFFKEVKIFQYPTTMYVLIIYDADLTRNLLYLIMVIEKLFHQKLWLSC